MLSIREEAAACLLRSFTFKIGSLGVVLLPERERERDGNKYEC
jgi:hypothetical protein